MNENFLSYLWRYKLLSTDLSTTSGETIEILKPGELNTNAGPDFLNARLRIGNTLWAGNVELHVLASDWYRHGHHLDNQYKNIILHLVFEDDLRGSSKEIPGLPVLCCKEKYDESIYTLYQSFIESKAWIPCAGLLRDIEPLIASHWLTAKAVERLERKSSLLGEIVISGKYNWENSFYIAVARAFGNKINADAFEGLARSISLKILAAEKSNLFRLEALLFGQAGMLHEKNGDEEYLKLKTEYQLLKSKYKLKGLPAGSFKFLRLRPPNFPTIRIAQFAYLIHKSSGLFSQVLNCSSTEALFALFNTRTSEYWSRHYRFGKISPQNSKKMGEDNVNLILVNTVVPFLFLYGRFNQNPEYCEKALSLLERLPPEENTIIRKFRTAGLAVSNALGTQALLEIKDKYCNAKRCLECGFGHHLFSDPGGQQV